MIAHLDSASIEPHVRAPGVALVDWYNPRDSRSQLFEQALDYASRIHPEVRFGSVDAPNQPNLVEQWAVIEIPTLMAYRDGILVFRYPGPLPPPVIDGLVQAVASLDMEEVRSGVDGQGSRISIAFVPEHEPPVQPIGHGGKGGGGGAPRGSR